MVTVITAAIVLVTGAVVAWTSNDDDPSPAPSTTVPGGSSTVPSTSAPPTTTTVESTSTAMWPFPGEPSPYTDPVEAARSFATDFLRFQSPRVGEFRQGDSRSGEVAVRPSADGPETTILVRQFGPDSRWWVLGSATDDIEVTKPEAGALVSSPVRVAGRALAFEGHVDVEVREDGELGALGRGFVTGGGDVLRPFEGTIEFETPGARFGALVFFTRSAMDGRVWQAASIRVAFRSPDIDSAACGSYTSPRPALAAGEMEVTAYFSCDADDSPPVHPVYRAVPRSPGVLRAALTALVAGPTADERANGISSFFSDATRDSLRSVTITDGHAIVDFADLRTLIPNASASAGSARLLAELDATVFQFRTVESVEYRIEGSCTDFTEWLQFGGCEPRTRGTSQD